MSHSVYLVVHLFVLTATKIMLAYVNTRTPEPTAKPREGFAFEVRKVYSS